MIIKIPGFRTNRKRNKVIGIIGYSILLLGILSLLKSGQTPIDSLVYELTLVIVFLGLFIPMANPFNSRNKIFLLNRKSIRGKIFGYIVFFICCLIMIGIVSSLKSDKEKAYLAADYAKRQEAKAAMAKVEEQKKADEDKQKQEVKAKADADAKAKAENDAKIKAVKEAQAKLDQDVKLKADADAKAKVEAEAKAKAEADAKAKADAEAKAKADADAKAAEEAKKKAIPGAISKSPEEFQKSFNASSSELNTNFKINKITLQEGPVQNTFINQFTKNLGITGTINKQDGSLRSVTLIGTGDGTMKSGTDIIIGMGVLLSATNHDLPADERGQILKELKFIGNKDVDVMNLDESTVRNGIKYSLSTSKEIGVLLTASDANDK